MYLTKNEMSSYNYFHEFLFLSPKLAEKKTRSGNMEEIKFLI